MKKREYKAPHIKTEYVNIGVFGSYDDNSDGEDGGNNGPINFFNPFFHFCCS